MRGSEYYWGTWFVLTVLTGITAGFLVSQFLIFGRLLSWILSIGKVVTLTQGVGVFRGINRPGMRTYFAICVLQALVGIGFLVVAVLTQRHVALASVAAAAGPLWLFLHYISGLARSERATLRNPIALAAQLADHYRRWNVPLHALFAFLLVIALALLLCIPLAELRRFRAF
jgi:hypothetical protein